MITYTPWSLRGYLGKVWQVYVEITNSRSIAKLIEVKRQLNNPPVTGLVLVDNSSPAVKRLGWERLCDGIWYRYFG